MPTNPQAPGVYVDFMPSGIQPIEGVATAITAFIGFTEKAEMTAEDGVSTVSARNKAVLVTSWDQYRKHFGGYVEGAYTPYAVKGYFDNGGKVGYVLSILDEEFLKQFDSNRAAYLHSAQLVVDTAEPSELPSLLIRAKRGGGYGNKISVSITHHPTDKSLFDVSFTDVGEGQVTLADVTTDFNSPKEISRAVAEDPTLKEKIEVIVLDRTGDPAKRRPKEIIESLQGGELSLEEINSELIKIAKELEDTPDKFKELTRLKRDEAVLKTENEKLEKELKGLKSKLSREQDETKQEQLQGQISPKEQRLAQIQTVELPQKGTEVAELEKDADLKVLLERRFRLPDKQQELVKLQRIYGQSLPTRIEGSVTVREGIGALEALDNVTLVCAPDLAMAFQRGWITDIEFRSTQKKMYEHCEKMKYRFAILDSPHNRTTVQQIREWRLNEAGYDTSYAALYFPWIQIEDPLNPGKKKAIPPCGHVAGIYARTDDERGVHKAPANEQVKGVIDLPLNVLSAEQETLDPQGVNCIRKFPGRGIRVYGANTLSTTDKSWKFISTRRLFNYVGASIDNATQWAVFEPNDEKLWAKVRRNVTSFLRNVWRSGALFGSSPEEAFYVRCDADLNNDDVLRLGQMIVEIGLRPVYPAVYVIFRISQWAGPGGNEG